jgi:hypothetical protein
MSDDKITISWLPADAAEPTPTSSGLLTEYERAMRARDSDQVTDTEREAHELANMTHRQKWVFQQQGEATARTGLTPRRYRVDKPMMFRGWDW